MKLLSMFRQQKIISGIILVVGIGLGLLWGWVIQPVEWTDVQPITLASNYQEEYLRMAIDSFRVNANEEMAKNRFAELGENGFPLLQTIKSNPGSIDPNFLIVFEQMLNKNNVSAGQAVDGSGNGQQNLNNNTDSANETAGSGSSWFTTLLIIVGILLALGAVAIAIFFYLRRRAAEFVDEEEDVEVEEDYSSPDEYNAQPSPKFQASTSVRSDANESFAQNQKQPFTRFQTTYVIGDDGYNDSFSIDARTGEFLGECGFGVSEFIGVGSPKKASAFEVWMFDKNDIQTITKVLVSPFAYKEPGFRSKVEAKGELVEIQPHKQVKLETATLFMIATISDVVFGQGMTEDPSHIEQITMDLAIWQK